MQVQENDVSGAGSSVSHGVLLIEHYRGEIALEVGKHEGLLVDVAALGIYGPDEDLTVVCGDEVSVAVVEEADLVGDEPGFASLAEGGVVAGEVVDVDGSVVDSSHGTEVLLIGGEGEGSDLDLVLLVALEEAVFVEVPEEDAGLEAHLGVLAGSDEAAGAGDGEGAEWLVRGAEEADALVTEVADDDGGS